MNILDRYLFRAVATATLVTELESVGQAQYDFMAALHYLLLIQPRRLYDLFPMALLVGSLLGMGALASGSELIVMRAAGLSLTRLTGAVAGTGLLLSIAVVLMGEFIAPPLEQFAREQRATAKGENLEIRGGRGFWARDGDDFIHVQAVLPGVRLAGIRVFRVNPDARLEWATHAESARYQEGRWQLEGISRSRLEGVAVASAISPQILDVLAARPDDLSFRDLRVYIDYLERNGLDAQSYQLAMWRKAFSPLAYLAMLVIAMPFVFGPQRASGAGQRLLIGLMLGLAFFLMNYLLGNVVLLYGYSPLVGASLPSLLFLGRRILCTAAIALMSHFRQHDQFGCRPAIRQAQRQQQQPGGQSNPQTPADARLHHLVNTDHRDQPQPAA